MSSLDLLIPLSYNLPLIFPHFHLKPSMAGPYHILQTIHPDTSLDFTRTERDIIESKKLFGNVNHDMSFVQ